MEYYQDSAFVIIEKWFLYYGIPKYTCYNIRGIYRAALLHCQFVKKGEIYPWCSCEVFVIAVKQENHAANIDEHITI